MRKLELYDLVIIAAKHGIALMVSPGVDPKGKPSIQIRVGGSRGDQVINLYPSRKGKPPEGFVQAVRQTISDVIRAEKKAAVAKPRIILPFGGRKN